MTDFAWLEEIIKDRTPGPWVTGYWSGQCNFPHQHSRKNCKYQYSLVRDWTDRIVNKETPITIVNTTEEYGTMTKEDARFIASMGTLANKIMDVVRAADDFILASFDDLDDSYLIDEASKHRYRLYEALKALKAAKDDL